MKRTSKYDKQIAGLVPVISIAMLLNGFFFKNKEHHAVTLFIQHLYVLSHIGICLPERGGVGPNSSCKAHELSC